MIRPATPEDVATMVALGAGMHAESPRFRGRSWNSDKVTDLIRRLIDSDDGLVLVAEQGGEIIGGFVGMIGQDWYGNDTCAFDFALYVAPRFRGGTTGLRLARAYAQWAQSRNVSPIMIGTTTGVEPEVAAGLYRLAGFGPTGHLFEFGRQ